MIRLELSDFDRETLESRAPAETAWANLEAAAEVRDTALAASAAIGWLIAHPTETLADLDRAVRSKNLDLRFFAADPPLGTCAVDPKDCSRRVPYWLVASCRPPEAANREVLEHWPSVCENHAALKSDTGVAMATPSTESLPVYELKAGREARAALRDANPGDACHAPILVMLNLARARTEDLGERLGRELDAYAASTGKRAEQSMVGMDASGAPLFAFTTPEGEFVTNIGLTIFHDENGDQQMKPVMLR